jgi:CheY-like chemotaxis protein
MLEKPVKEPISHESSRSMLSSLRTWPSVTELRAESRAANRYSLPCPDEEGEKQPVYIKHGSWVLVADDDTVLRFLFGDALKGKGLRVFSAPNGLEALELYRENADKIWMVISDVMMPGMDGLTAAVEMRKIDKNVFFMFMSGHDPQEIKEAGLNIEDVPDSNFYQKPFAFRDIIGRIRIVDHSRESARNHLGA